MMIIENIKSTIPRTDNAKEFMKIMPHSDTANRSIVGHTIYQSYQNRTFP